MYLDGGVALARGYECRNTHLVPPAKSRRPPAAGVPEHRPALAGFEVALHDLDVGSAGGARWIDDDCSDPLAQDVQRAIEELVNWTQLRTPAKDVLRGTLLGEGHPSPSFTWHA